MTFDAYIEALLAAKVEQYRNARAPKYAALVCRIVKIERADLPACTLWFGPDDMPATSRSFAYNAPITCPHCAIALTLLPHYGFTHGGIKRIHAPAMFKLLVERGLVEAQ